MLLEKFNFRLWFAIVIGCGWLPAIDPISIGWNAAIYEMGRSCSVCLCGQAMQYTWKNPALKLYLLQYLHMRFSESIKSYSVANKVDLAFL